MKNQTTKNPKNNTISLDATDQPLGRLATKVSCLLMGKDKPSFRPHKEGEAVVEVQNIKNVKITGKKLTSKKYYHHSGYPGGLKEVPMEKIFKKNPEEVLRRAVYGMLPKNKLRDRRIKRLKFV